MKSHAKISTILSLLFMGLGQIYNRQYMKGLLFICLEIYIVVFWSLPFRNAMWGLTTLGETTQKRIGFKIQPGDHSIFLMIEGIIFLICGLLLIWVYYLNIRDARRVGIARDLGQRPNHFKETLHVIAEKGISLFAAYPFNYIYIVFDHITAIIRYCYSLYQLFGTKPSTTCCSC
nr:hypothetical protein [Heyndrickxia oleronia]